MNSMTSRSAARDWFVRGLALSAVVTFASLVKASSHEALISPTVIEIIYDGDCPDAINTTLKTDVKRGEQVRWQSVDKSGGTITRKYEIYFDPFVGNPIKSVGDGKTNPRTIDTKIPEEVDYKYTVVTINSSNNCDPLDPRLRVRN